MLWNGKLICGKCKKKVDELFETETDYDLMRQGHGQSLCRECITKHFPIARGYKNECAVCGNATEGRGYFVDVVTGGGKIKPVVVCDYCLPDALWKLYEDGDNGFVFERNGERRSAY